MSLAREDGADGALLRAEGGLAAGTAKAGWLKLTPLQRRR